MHSDHGGNHCPILLDNILVTDQDECKVVRDTHCVTMVDILPEEQCEVEWEEQCSHTPETQCVPVLETQCEESVTEVCEEHHEEVCTHTTEHVTEHHAVIQGYNYVQSVPFVGRTGLIDELYHLIY